TRATGRPSGGYRARPAMPDCAPSAVPLRSASALFVPRLEITLAVIAASGAPWRAVTGGFGVVAGTRVRAARSLHQHAAALAISDQAAFAARPGAVIAARPGDFALVNWRRSRAMDRPIEIRT